MFVLVPACPLPLGCIPPGAQCCGTIYYFWPETSFCCPGGAGSCTLGTTCCGDSYCCKTGATCSSGECVRPVTVMSTSRTSPTRTSSPTSTTKTTSSQTEACTIDPDIEKRGTLEVFKIDYQEISVTLQETGRVLCLDNRELMHSMCKGGLLSWCIERGVNVVRIG